MKAAKHTKPVYVAQCQMWFSMVGKRRVFVRALDFDHAEFVLSFIKDTDTNKAKGISVIKA